MKITRELFGWKQGKAALWQYFAVFIVLLFVAGLHWSNDGLWYQGDAPRHAANGLFWWDFLTSLPVNPFKFAVSYFARYPVIHPTAYPPLFYIIEGFAFRILGASPFIAKGLVLAFALLAGFYLTAWLRRWVSEESGWAGPLILMQPGIVMWMNAVMLNVPSMALGLATLFHMKRWIEAPTSRQLYATILFGIAGILTYVPTGIVVLVGISWLVIERRIIIPTYRRILILGALSVLVLLPWAWIQLHWASAHVGGMTDTVSNLIRNSSRWMYYFKNLPTLFSVPVLLLSVLGVIAGFWDKSCKREVRLLVTWLIVCYLGFSYLRFREPRYVLLLGPPIVLLSMIGLAFLFNWKWGRQKRQPWLSRIGIAAMLVFHIWRVPAIQVPAITGFQEIVAFLEKVAPEEIVFYDGNYDGILTFYLRATDPGFHRGVLLGSKLLYTSAITVRAIPNRGSTPEEVVKILQKEGGCRWVLVERQGFAARIPAARSLRAATSGPEFQLIKSFPIERKYRATTWVDIFRFLPPTEKSDKRKLSFPAVEKDATFEVSPIRKTPDGRIHIR